MDTKLIATLSVAAVVGVVGGFYIATQQRGAGDQFTSCRASNVAGGAGSVGGDFELVASDGRTVTASDVITEPSLLYFGYTFCPDVCPFDVARNADAVDILAERRLQVQPVFITVDPARDTPEVVGDFAAALHERMIGLTGSQEQIDAAVTAYRAYYKLHDDDEEFYLVDHSTFTYLVLPEHGFVEFFRREATPEEMADRVACFLANT